MAPRRLSPAISPVIGAMLLVGITVVLSALVYLMLAGFPAGLQSGAMEQPQRIGIREVYREGTASPYPNCWRSCVVLRHEGTKPLENNDLIPVFYRNEVRVPVNIPTMNGYEFVKQHPAGVRLMEGDGCKGASWDPGEEIRIEFNKGTFQQGDRVRVEISSESGVIILPSDTFLVS
jgi:Archaeal Type IV pilin, N-terminal